MESTNHPVKQALEELFALLEAMETQSLAILQFLKDQKISTDEQLAPYMDQASNAASVKWRAARARMEYLFSSTENKPAVSEESKQKAAETKKTEENSEKEANVETADENGATKQPTEAKPTEEKGGAKNLRPRDSAAKETAKSDSRPANRNEAGSDEVEKRKTEELQAKNSEEKKEMRALQDAKPEGTQKKNTEKATLAAGNADPRKVEIKKAGKENSAAQKRAASRT